jgi:hypothetical protein
LAAIVNANYASALAMINVTLLVALMFDTTGAEGFPICWGSLAFKHVGLILMPRIFILGVRITVLYYPTSICVLF